jgi:hypothetical protein
MSRKIITLKKIPGTRPLWGPIADSAIAEEADVRVHTLGDFHAFRRAVRGRGYFVWRHRVDEDEWILRVTQDPKASKTLAREYGREYKTSHGVWLRRTDDLMGNQTVRVPDRKTVSLLRVNLRKYYPPEQFPDIVLRYKEVKGGWDTWIERTAPAKTPPPDSTPA